MNDKPVSPFARLDTNLMRSTQQREAPAPAVPVVESAPALAPVRPASIPKANTTRKSNRDTATPRNHDTTTSTTVPFNQETMTRSDQGAMVDTIRKAVRVVGKEAATLRLSADEKTRLADIIYTYKRQGKRTSETELIRIALNFILEDYQENGSNGVLAQAVEALNS